MKPNSMCYFPFFVNDFLGSMDVQMMDADQVGAYTLLLAWQWNGEGCRLPNDMSMLSKLARLDLSDSRNEIVLKKFRQEDGWYNSKLMNVYQEQLSKYTRMCEGGRKGGLKGGLEGGGIQPEPEPDPNPEPKPYIPTWRDDFAVYLEECRTIYIALMGDSEWVAQQEKFHPNVDIRLSLEKAFTNFWGTETGWKYKKKAKSKDLDWRSTFTNAIDMNKVWKPKSISNGSPVSDRIARENKLKRLKDRKQELTRRWDDDAKMMYPKKWEEFQKVRDEIKKLEAEMNSEVL